MLRKSLFEEFERLKTNRERLTEKEYSDELEKMLFTLKNDYENDRDEEKYKEDFKLLAGKCDTKLLFVLKNLPMLLWTTDTKLNITFSKGRGLQDIDLEDDEVVKSKINIYDFLGTTDENYPPIKAHHDALKGLATNYESEFGGIKRFNFVEPFYNDEDKVIGVIGFSLDVTEHLHIKGKLQSIEERYKKLFENNTANFLLLDAKTGEILNSSDAGCLYYGYSKNQLKTKTIFDLTNMTVEEYNNYVELTRTNNLYSFLHQHKLANGEIRDVEVNAQYYVENNREQIFSIVFDVTEKLNAERKLKESEAIISSVIKNIPFEFWVRDKNEVVIMQNKASIAHLGELLNQNVDQHDIPDDIKELWKDINKTVLNGETIIAEIPFTQKNGSQIYYYNILAPIIDSSGDVSGMLGINIDISDRKQFEEDLIVAKEQAERSNELKGEFLAQMSHEIRTPVGAIMSFAQLLHDFEYTKSDEVNMIFEGIESSGKRIIRTINMLLNVTELQNGIYDYSPEKLNLVNDVLSPLIQEYSYQAKLKNLELIFESTAECDLFIIADTYSITHIYTNLIDNAIKYTNKGFVKVRVDCEDGRVSVSVSDTGIGIATEYIHELFEPFSQEEIGYTRTFEGTGLGLTLVKEYCKLNNAIVKFDSKKGVGTTFTVEMECFECIDNKC